jgi:hypothetical protein
VELHDQESGGKFHGVAKSHEEAVRVDVEGGGVDERTCTTNDDQGTEMARRPVDDEAAHTPDPHAKCAEPTRPADTSHEPANEWFSERESGGMVEAEPESISPSIEGRRGRMPTDRADEAKPLLGDDPNGTMAKVQGGGCGSGHRCAGLSDASGESLDSYSGRLEC